MKVDTDEFIRRFMLHILPSGFHRIRHYGLLSSKVKLKQSRQLLDVAEPEPKEAAQEKDEQAAPFMCRDCHLSVALIFPILFDATRYYTVFVDFCAPFKSNIRYLLP
jgi:hypothetical protein